MKSRRTRRFRELFATLSPDVRRQVYAAFRLFKRNPYHASLQFKRLNTRSPIYSVRIGIGYRALGRREKNDEDEVV